ncbi:MAG: flagellar biosynthetic protein FliR [Planctomycetota bacterium]|jgi:flagellar biosynthetic protein FliR|nr:flagellar biosynthetic protein FliR [Blastopirellula sp.]
MNLVPVTLTTVLGFLLILARVSAFIAAFPLFARRQIPTMVKAGLAVALSIFWFGTLAQPLVPENLTALDANTFTVSLWILREVVIGIVLGLLAGLLLLPAKIAGAYAGQELGLTLGAQTDPTNVEAGGEVTQIFETLSLLAFFGLNLHHFAIILVHASFEQLGRGFDLLELPTDRIVALFGSLEEYGLSIVAPLAICMFALNLALVLLNKVAPSLNLFSIGTSVRGVVGVFCLFLFFPVIFRALALYFQVVQTGIEKALGG